uniref:HDC09875 n=1 Tax=Drosophila melanogaster TaxID=7227 RepID=Q6ILB0_DROME|nr:TPA_inf: HDC09875 [Drosophila melanogaster]
MPHLRLHAKVRARARAPAESVHPPDTPGQRRRLLIATTCAACQWAWSSPVRWFDLSDRPIAIAARKKVPHCCRMHMQFERSILILPKVHVLTLSDFVLPPEHLLRRLSSSHRFWCQQKGLRLTTWPVPSAPCRWQWEK